MYTRDVLENIWCSESEQLRRLGGVYDTKHREPCFRRKEREGKRRGLRKRRQKGVCAFKRQTLW